MVMLSTPLRPTCRGDHPAGWHTVIGSGRTSLCWVTIGDSCHTDFDEIVVRRGSAGRVSALLVATDNAAHTGWKGDGSWTRSSDRWSATRSGSGWTCSPRWLSMPTHPRSSAWPGARSRSSSRDGAPCSRRTNRTSADTALNAPRVGDHRAHPARCGVPPMSTWLSGGSHPVQPTQPATPPQARSTTSAPWRGPTDRGHFSPLCQLPLRARLCE